MISRLHRHHPLGLAFSPTLWGGFLVMMLLLPVSVAGDTLPPDTFEAPTLSVMNSPTAKARIGKGFFRPLYRGFGQRTPLGLAQNELLGFRFLFDSDALATTLLARWNDLQKQGMKPDEALRQAKRGHLDTLKREFARMESLKQLYENEKGKDCEIEYHFLFSTPHLAIARCYGPVVMVIEELQPRGLDLNGIARDDRYYSVARALKNLANLRWRTVAADYVLDRDEYVIPSFITPQDITGIIVYEPSPIVVMKRLPVVPPKVVRVYRKRHLNGGMVIDVFDGQDRLIERLSPTPWAVPVDPTITRSPAKLPPAITEAWKAYVAKRRRPGTRR